MKSHFRLDCILIAHLLYRITLPNYCIILNIHILKYKETHEIYIYITQSKTLHIP